MLRSRNRFAMRGVTLVELMIALVVLAVIVAAAVPSFVEFRERSIARGAADQAISFWGNTRFEAVKRNTLIAVTFARNGSGEVCMGADATTAFDENTACDCFTAGSCDIARFPEAQAEWRGALLTAAPALGTSNSGVVVIDPKTGFLTEPGDAGTLTFRSPSATKQYQLRVVVDGQGRASLCEPTGSPLKMPEYINRRC